ncbi:hypothetical protein EYC80_008390 [Monilinia laxa]|uniref:DNA recombination and repair protein Rad51-like C-terminal domain-containing protein n=1 Tax=Monilinia laxa TaxID=61186 RepID=A0A5N6JQ40_MONLA|nr:hypothetical protein EYC80_008390 [Monilinia laxa]
MEQIKSSEEIFGGRLLREVEESEESLESLLATLTNTLNPLPPKTHIPSLDALWSQQNQLKLSVSGRQLPLLIYILTTLLKVEKSVVLIDTNSRFSPSFLPIENENEDGNGNNKVGRTEEGGKLKKSDLKHLHIFRPSPKNLEVTLKGIEEYILYGEHESHGREFGGTVLFGFDARDAGGNAVANVKGMGRPEIMMGWRGWLRIEREEVAGFGVGVSAEEMLGERGRREEVS